MLSEFCIKRPVFTWLLMLAIVVGGVAGYRTLAVSALPKVDFPTIQVTANLTGASPETMASSVATPLERQFSTIAGITSMTSSSYLGTTSITLQFDLGRDIDGAALDVQTAISATLRKLPPEMTSPPSFQKVNPADQPIFFIAVSSDTLPIAKVNDYAETLLGQRISTLPGVAQVQIFGSQKYAVRMQADPQKLAAYDLDFQELKAAIAAAASNSPLGVISGERQLFNLDIEGQPTNASEFRPIVVTWRNGAPVRLGDIAVITDSVEDLRSAGNIDGRRAVVLAIQRQADANTIEVVEKVRALLPEFRAQLPASVVLTPMFDRSVSVRESVDDVEFTLYITIALVVMVIFLFLRRMAATVIAGLAVPLSIIATYGMMAVFGFSLNNISLLAVTLCVGFVVDDAIVMIENIIRHMEKGLSPMQAALKGAGEVGFTIISMTLSLVAVFIPVLFMGGIVGRLFHEFAVTISVAILVSGLVSLTLTPMLCSRWLKAHAPETGWGRKLEAGFDALLGVYSRSLRWAVHHRRFMLGLTILSLVLTIAAFRMVPKSFFPLEDTGFIFASTEAAQDISFEAMLAKQKQISEIMRADPAVQSVFFGLGGNRGAINSARMFFSLKPQAEREPASVVIQRLRGSLSAVKGVNVFMQPVQNIQIGGQRTKALYQYTLQSSDLEALQAEAARMEQALQKLPGFLDVSTDLQLKSLEARLIVDPEKAAQLGLTYEDVREALYAAFGNAQVATLYTSTNDYQVILEVPTAAQRTPEDIKNLYIRSKQGALVPMEAIGNIVQGTGPLSVQHMGQMPSVTISFNLKEGTSLSQALQAIQKTQEELGLPETVTSSFQGTAKAFQDSAKGQGLLLLFTIIVVYIILGMLYESFIHPLTILSGLPSAGLGALATLLLFGEDLSVIAFIGIILLIGIVKKNAIMMVDFAVDARRQGADAESAILDACHKRFRPIMMTTMAAIFGGLPIALGIGAGAELRQPLGLAVVGGLLTSQLLTLYITPVIYLYLERFSRKPA